MVMTRTGSFPICFRRNRASWQADLDALIQFACDHGFSGIDLHQAEPDQIQKVQHAGLQIGSVDLLRDLSDLASPDSGRRKAIADANAHYISTLAKHGIKTFFALMPLPEPESSRSVYHQRAIQGWTALCDQVQSIDVHIVLEGYPGTPPYYPNLACTPESYRAVLKDLPHGVVGVNYDPSHLVRMGIDPIRFLNEFVDQVYHVHAKDTEILHEALYEYGNTQDAVFAKARTFGGYYWRYTIPGHGQVRWGKVFSILRDANYEGLVSIELEDENFSKSAEDEQRGLLAARDFLVNA